MRSSASVASLVLALAGFASPDVPLALREPTALPSAERAWRTATGRIPDAAAAWPRTAEPVPPLHVVLDVAADRPAGPVDVTVEDLAGDRLLALCAARHGRTADGTVVQLDSIATAGGPGLRLRFVARAPLHAGEHALVVRFDGDPATVPFRFQEERGHLTLLRGEQRVHRFERAFDPERFAATCKPFHHVFAPGTGTRLTKDTDGHFPHHRGIFLGYGETRRGDEVFDFWHCTEGVFQRWRRPPSGDLGMAPRAGAVAADTVARVAWCDAEGAAVIEELRSLTAWNVGASAHLLDVTCELRAGGEEAVELGGDPHHGGLQFRAAEEVHAHPESTSYVLQPGALGGEDDVWTDCAWVACRMIVQDREWLVQHHTHPDGPSEWRYSTRAYGRFGSFAPATVEPGRTFVLRHRIVVSPVSGVGSIAPGDVHSGFVTPIHAHVRSRDG